ncbi:hypothetical protein CDG81_22990 [Actinopolyspora erythraea]|uniref:Uncharacterized protein n=1 Tax=Actinopolyspora erythraea TaxID=414996 RepID=A0A099DAS9_9ACTN|nr:hypothetical protein [Actinopolyspora erythraea]ASU80656.1 hypothetical protein CDG81_22990 [Actinopolyspora erythraea]KGI82976.1 hypothetical protein IL38_01830 [Actinopolyspora erythraea]
MATEHTAAALRRAAEASRNAGDCDPTTGGDCRGSLKPLRAAVAELAEPIGASVRDLLALTERTLLEELRHDPETAAKLSRALDTANEWTDELTAWLRRLGEQREG